MLKKDERVYSRMIFSVSCFRNIILGDFPGGPVVETLPSNAGVLNLTPGGGAKIPHT